ncbi:MAG: Type 1 glutamine amidotransferase-like domain-containing protein [Cellulosilyticaceae bacterium]
MHLILTSSDFGNETSKKFIIDHLTKPIEQCKVLFFPNEKATKEMIQSDKYIHWMQSRGFIKENITIFDYTRPQHFANLALDCIHISGGNTFYTLERLRQCHADQLILDYITQGVTYIGGSAGTHLLTKNLKHLIPFDKDVPDHFDFDGLGLFDGILFCHYSDARKVYCEKALNQSPYPVYKLTDEEGIVISY